MYLDSTLKPGGLVYEPFLEGFAPVVNCLEKKTSKQRQAPPTLQFPNDLLEGFYFLLDIAAFAHHLLDGRYGVHGRAVVAVKLLSDVVERQIEQLTTQIYSYLPRVDNVACAFGADEIEMLHLEEILNFSLDIFDCEIFR